MKAAIMAVLLGATLLAGCGGSSTVSTGQAYTPHCYQFRQRHLLILHRYYVLKFYNPSSFYHYLSTHHGLQYRRVSCSGNYGYAAGYGYAASRTRGGSKIGIVKNLYQRYKAYRASRSSQGSGSGFHLFHSSGRHR